MKDWHPLRVQVAVLSVHSVVEGEVEVIELVYLNGSGCLLVCVSSSVLVWARLGTMNCWTTVLDLQTGRLKYTSSLKVKFELLVHCLDLQTDISVLDFLSSHCSTETVLSPSLSTSLSTLE